VAGLQRKDVTRPDEVREIPGGRIEMFELGDVVVSKSSFEPGWRWSTHIKPLAGTELCEFHHQGYTMSGRVHVITRGGAEIELSADQFYEIPAHHDAWVVGDEPWVSIDWGPATSFAMPAWGNEKRVVSSVLFTDIVDSTVRARELGDGPWRDLLDRHNGIVRGVLHRFGGREVNTTGDGFLALFDSAERAIHAARAMASGVHEIGVEIRAGVHTGEVELVGDDVRGLAVHVAARVMSLAGPGEVLVSWTTRDLLAGSRTTFEERGEHELKGIPSPRAVYAVSRS
jgi:class 3 adenylate cyclase